MILVTRQRINYLRVEIIGPRNKKIGSVSMSRHLLFVEVGMKLRPAGGFEGISLTVHVCCKRMCHRIEGHLKAVILLIRP